MSIRDTELEFEVNDTYWLDELDARFEAALLDEDEDIWLDEDDWAIGDDEHEPYDEFEDYDDYADWDVDYEDDEI